MAAELASTAQAALGAALRVAAAPWVGAAQFAARWVALLAGLVLQSLAWAGVSPAGFAPAAKIRELEGVIEHMHRREDSYRQALRELQEGLEAKEGDKRKALRGLKKARLELDLVSEELAQLQAASPAGPGSSGGGFGAAQPSRGGLHSSMAAVAAAVGWFYQQEGHSAIQRKLVFCLLFPLTWLYLTGAVLARRRPSGAAVQLLCACWFLLGFVAAARFAAC